MNLGGFLAFVGGAVANLQSDWPICRMGNSKLTPQTCEHLKRSYDSSCQIPVVRNSLTELQSDWCMEIPWRRPEDSAQSFGGGVWA